MSSRKKGKYLELDEPIIDLLAYGPQTIYRLAKTLHRKRHEIEVVVKRLKFHGRVTWTQSTTPVELKAPNNTRDPSPFPRPWWRTPDVGWFG